MMRAVVWTLGALYLSGGANAQKSVFCDQLIEGNYTGSPIPYTFLAYPNTTHVIRTCGYTDWDTMLTIDGGLYENDDMEQDCLANPAASEVVFVPGLSAPQTYQLTFGAGVGHDGTTDLPFAFHILCRPTQNKAAYTTYKFMEVAPSVNTSLLSCVDSIWYYDGARTCVGCGDWPDPCPIFNLFCAGNGNNFGYTVQQAMAVEVALNEVDGRHPNATDKCQALLGMGCLDSPGDFQCLNGVCLNNTALLCDCINDCGDGSDEDHVLCGYPELTCNGGILTGDIGAGSSAGYFFSIDERLVVNPRTCVNDLTDADTMLELWDSHGNLITQNEDCGEQLCPYNPEASGVARPADAGTYRVCIKPGAAYAAPPNNYAVELRCNTPLDNYWRDTAAAFGLDHELLMCIDELDTWMYNGTITCVACGFYKDPCNEEGLYCAGGLTYGTGSQQVEAVVEALDNGGAHPDVTCPSLTEACTSYSTQCNVNGTDTVAADLTITQITDDQVFITLNDLGDATLTSVRVGLFNSAVDIPLDVDLLECGLENIGSAPRPLQLLCPIPDVLDSVLCVTGLNDLVVVVTGDVLVSGGEDGPLLCLGLDGLSPFATLECPCEILGLP